MSHRYVHYSIAFSMQMVMSIAALAVPLLATELHASTLEVGVIGSAGAAAYTFTVIFAGALSDKLGRKRVIIAGSIFAGLSFALMPASRSAAHLIFLMALSGCALAFFWPVLEAWMSDEGDSEEVRKGLGGFNVSWSVGACLGPLIGGLIYTKSSTFTFLFAAVGACAVAFLAYLHRKPAAPQDLPADDPHLTDDIRRVAVSRSFLYAVWGANFASWFAISEIRMLFPKLALGVLGMQPWVIGILIFALGLALPVAFYSMGNWRFWQTSQWPLLLAQLLIVPLLLSLAVASSAAALGVIFALVGAAFGVTYSYSLYYSVIGSVHKGAASARHEMMIGLGGFLGPLLGGVAAELFHTQRAPYVLGALLVLASVGAQLLASPRPRVARGYSPPGGSL